MRNAAGEKISSSSMGRREFLRTLGATTVGAAGITGIMGPFDFARAAITPGERGIYITDLRTATIQGNLDHPTTIIRLDTNKAISGYGEVRDNDTSTASQLSTLKPIILGMNPTQVDKVFNAVKSYGVVTPGPNQRNASGGVCAVEMACWDITGKVYNVPVWKLIGPKLRDTVRLYADTPVTTPTSALQQQIQIRLNLGMTWFKADFGLGMLTSGTDYTTSPETMPAGFGTAYRVNSSGMTKWENYIKSYRDVIGYTYPLCSDHYGNIDVTTAINVANAMGQMYQMAWMEDIVPWYYPDLLTQINAATDTHILTGEDMFLRNVFQSLINAKAVDYIHPDQATSGGIHETRILSEWAWANGISTALHFAGTPISFAANLHIAAGLHGLLALEHHWLDYITWWQTLGDGLVKPVVQNGYAVIPTGPGLGVVPNPAACTAVLSSGGYFTQ